MTVSMDPVRIMGNNTAHKRLHVDRSCSPDFNQKTTVT
jgi:hypothetical protein